MQDFNFQILSFSEAALLTEDSVLLHLVSVTSAQVCVDSACTHRTKEPLKSTELITVS